MKNNRVEIMGCPVDNLSKQETLEFIDRLIQSGGCYQHVVINADKLLKLRKDASLRRIISACDIINADGMAIVWASRVLNKPLKERVAGIDLMSALIERSLAKNYKLYFLGAREEVVRKMVDNYRRLYPRLNISGYRNGFFEKEEEQQIADEIKRLKPHILFVGMSSPKKEVFLNKYLQVMQVPFCMGVGGSFDVAAGISRRAPVFLRKAGLEWCFRLLQEPTRMWKRYCLGNAQFVFLLFWELLLKLKRDYSFAKNNPL